MREMFYSVPKSLGSYGLSDMQLTAFMRESSNLAKENGNFGVNGVPLRVVNGLDEIVDECVLIA